MKFKIKYNTKMGMAARKDQIVNVETEWEAVDIAVKNATADTYTFTLWDYEKKINRSFSTFGREI